MIQFPIMLAFEFLVNKDNRNEIVIYIILCDISQTLYPLIMNECITNRYSKKTFMNR